MHTRAGIILQARVGSTRLPRKALEPIGGVTLVERCLRRLMWSGVADVVLATTTLAEDDVLAAMGRRLGVAVFRGDEDDVLGRFVEAARAFNFDPIIRATGDNPCVDLLAPVRTLEALQTTGVDYVVEEGLPVGACVEGVTRTALRYAAETATEARDREHVTTYIKRRRGFFTFAEVDAPAALRRPELSVTVDTHADLQWVRELYFRTATDEPTLGQIITAADYAALEAATLAADAVELRKAA
jgi:spore coat polysaccharide biosynthesis protein SpsF